MIALGCNALTSSLAWIRSARPILSLVVLTGFCPFCFGQLPADLDLPSETINSGNPVFEASNSITNSGNFVVQDSASVTLAAGSSIRLEPGFDAVAGNASFTFFGVIDPNVGQIPNEGDGPPSIPSSYTAPEHAPTCDNISGVWVDSDNVGNSVGWDLNQNGSSIAGTLSFDAYRDFGYGPTYCGRISYSASGFFDGNSFSLSAVNPVPSTDGCGLPVAPSETETVTLSGQACGGGTGAYTISSGGGGGAHALYRTNPSPASAGAQPRASINASAQPAATSGSSTWSTYSPRFIVSYASYIPVDHINGPTPCYFSVGAVEPVQYPVIYKGDANRGSYRTTQSILVVPDKQFSNNFFANTGATRNYGFGSPAGGANSTLSSDPASPDIYNGPYTGADEDGNADDCFKWNARGHASTADMQTHGVTFPRSNQAVVTLSGNSSNPLEPQIGSIDWNATITLDTTDPSHPTAQVSITHTCYPAHIVKVNGVIVVDDKPRFNNLAWVSTCLLDPTGLSNTTTSTGTIAIPSH